MTAYELYRVLELAVQDGHGEAPVYFDTEARTFNYHMAKVGKAFCQEDAAGDDEAWIILTEKFV